MKIPPNKHPDSFWASKKGLFTEQEIYDWSMHDFNNFNTYTFANYKAWLLSCKQFFAKDFVMSVAGGCAPVEKIDGYIAQIELFFTAFSSLNINVEDFFVKDDKLAVNYTMSGKNTGEFMGSPATNKEFNVRALEIFRFKNGQMHTGFSMQDAMVFMQQLGMM
jgi:steroid delta-isomerase-like uncharacterized protein